MKKNKAVYVWMLCLSAYMILLLCLTVFRYKLIRPEWLFVGMFQNGKIFLIPFKHMTKIYSDCPQYFVQLFLENILMFVPIGISLRKIYGDRMPIARIILTGFLISLSIEFMQYMFGTGESEIDDLILNTAGAFFGGEICIISENFIKKRRKKQ